MRPIDADALIDEIKKDTEKVIKQDDRVGSFWLGYIAGLVIKQPTAQTSTSDLISRQAAIDALDFEIVHMTAYCDGKNDGNPLAQYNKGLEDGKKAIEALPPAQPEHKARFADKDHVWIDGKQYISLRRFQEAVKEAQSKEGEWVQIQKCTCDAQPDLECPFCKHRIGWFDMGRYCAGCGAKLKGGAG